MSFLRRRLLVTFGVVLLALLGVGLVGRIYLAGLAISSALKVAGATDVRFQVTQVSFWRMAVKDVGFLLHVQPLAAGRVTLDRTHWWTPSLGTLRVEEARVPVKMAALAKETPAASAAPSRGTASLPFDAISIDGQLVIQAEGQPDQALTLKLAAHPSTQGVWAGTAEVTALGLGLRGEGSYDLRSGDLAFKIPEATLDLQPWQGFLQQLAPAPAEDWIVEGKLSGNAEGRLAGDKLTASGRVTLREGRAVSAAKAITAEGVEADLEFTDFAAATTKPGTLSIRELRTGQLVLRDFATTLALEETDRIAVGHATLQALGGSVTAEPFTLVPSRAELEAVLLADGISIEEVMALTEDLPAKASGRVNGRVPVHLGADGLRFGTGWLALKPGVQAAIQFNAKGLLTGGAAPGTPSYAVLQKVETGLLKLRVNELRLDIRPPNAPADRSAQLHVKGEPIDPEIKAPVILDLNVNGPLEKLINMGMDSRLSIGGTKP
ncbi:MAG TPA: YdbH domain-containing protein [Lacunisphaera sp.]